MAVSTSVVVYHRTLHAVAILAGGFQDDAGWTGLSSSMQPGVYVSSVPLGEGEGAPPGELVEISLPSHVDLLPYRLCDAGTRYDEWLLPAEVLNEHGSIRVIYDAG